MEEISASPLCDLGRKEYWEKFYSKELENFGEFGDEGDIWFGKKNVERITKWMLEKNMDRNAPVLDVGCGNGITLVCLGKAGFTDLTGIDYAAEAIELAENIAKKHNVDIKFQVMDILQDGNKSANIPFLHQEFNVIIDKGTYDAVSLCPNDAKSKRLLYVKNIQQLLHREGYFLLFSCNWTKEELLQHFCGLQIHDEIKIPSIGFGGKTGQTVTAIILKKSN